MRKLLIGETWQLPLVLAVTVVVVLIVHASGGSGLLCAVPLIVGAALALAASLRA